MYIYSTRTAELFDSSVEDRDGFLFASERNSIDKVGAESYAENKQVNESSNRLENVYVEKESDNVGAESSAANKQVNESSNRIVNVSVENESDKVGAKSSAENKQVNESSNSIENVSVEQKSVKVGAKSSAKGGWGTDTYFTKSLNPYVKMVANKHKHVLNTESIEKLLDDIVTKEAKLLKQRGYSEYTIQKHLTYFVPSLRNELLSASNSNSNININSNSNIDINSNSNSNSDLNSNSNSDSNIDINSNSNSDLNSNSNSDSNSASYCDSYSDSGSYSNSNSNSNSTSASTVDLDAVLAEGLAVVFKTQCDVSTDSTSTVDSDAVEVFGTQCDVSTDSTSTVDVDAVLNEALIASLYASPDPEPFITGFEKKQYKAKAPLQSEDLD
jgi:hypothetical protein